jgi:uncharacterized membrane protein YqjE
MTDVENAGAMPPADEPRDKPPGWIDDVGDLVSGVKRVAGSHFRLLGAEVALARSGIVMMLFMALAATTFAVGLGFTLMALLGWALFLWLGSWTWALSALALGQVLLLVGSIIIFKRCMAWLGLPVSRAELKALVKEATEHGVAEGEAYERVRKAGSGS